MSRRLSFRVALSLALLVVALLVIPSPVGLSPGPRSEVLSHVPLAAVALPMSGDSARPLLSSGGSDFNVTLVPVGSTPFSEVFDTSSGEVYTGGAGELTVLLGTSVVGVVPTVFQVWSLAYDDSNGYVYCGVDSDGFESVVDVVSGTTLLKTIGLGGFTLPNSMAYDAGDGDVYVANQHSANVTVISGESVAANLAAGTNLLSIAYDPTDGDVYALSPGGSLTVVSGTSVVGSVSIGVATGAPEDVVYDPADGDMYAANSAQDTVSVVSGTSAVATVGVGKTPERAVYDGYNGYVYVANAGSLNATLLDGTGVVGWTPSFVDLGEVLAMAVNASDGAVFITGEYTSVPVLSGTGLVTTLTTGSYGDAALFDPQDSEVYISDMESNSTAVISQNGSLGPAIGSFTAAPTTIPLGGTTYLNVSASGGAGTLAYSYTGLPTGCTSADKASVACSPTVAGSFAIRVFVNDTRGRSASAAATLQVVGSAPHYTVSFTVHPTSCPIAFNGTSQTSGSTNSFLAGTFAATSPYCDAEWSFVQWNTTGGVSIGSPTSSTTTATVSGAGTLSAYYDWAGPVPVTFHISPASCGTIVINGSTYANGATGNLYLGGYTMSVNPCSYYVFHQWNSTGGVSVAYPTASTSSITLTAQGTLTAWFVWSGTSNRVPRFHLTFDNSPSACPLQFNGTTQANGTTSTFLEGNYSIAAPSCTGYAFEDFVVIAGLASWSSNISPNTVDVVGNGTANATYWRAPPPPTYTLTFHIAPPSCGPMVFNGSSQSDGSTASFPAGTYTAHASACPGFTFWAWELAPTSVLGTVQYYYTPWANVTITEPDTLSLDYVPPPLTVSLVTSSTSVVVGVSAALTPSVSGGYSPYTCLWSLNGTNTTETGCAGSMFTWDHPGTYAYRVWATDDAYDRAVSNAVTITVSAPPLLTVSGSVSPRGYSGGCGNGSLSWTFYFVGTATGGEPPVAYRWSFGDGSPEETGSQATHTYLAPVAAAGVVYAGPPWTAVVTAADPFGQNASANVTVDASYPACPVSTQTPVSPGFSLLGLSEAESVVLLVAVVAVAVVALLIVVLRRRKRQEPPPPPSSPSPEVAWGPPPSQ